MYEGASFFSVNSQPLIIMYAMVSILTYPRVISGLLTLHASLFFAYAMHRLLHTYDVPFLTHWHWLHHNEHVLGKDAWLPKATEFFINFFFLTGLFLIFIVPDYYLPHDVLLLTAIVYTSIHLINYHAADIDFHRQHHRDPATNFGPWLIDALMGTHVGPMENLKRYLPNVFAAYAVILILKLFRLF